MITGQIPYDEIFGIDEHGDDIFHHPHVYAHFNPGYGPFSNGIYANLVTYNPTRESYPARREDQIKYFPDTYPDIDDNGEPL